MITIATVLTTKGHRVLSTWSSFSEASAEASRVRALYGADVYADVVALKSMNPNIRGK